MARTPFRSQVQVEGVAGISSQLLRERRPLHYLARYFTGEAAGRIAASGEGSATQATRLRRRRLSSLRALSAQL